VVPSKMYGILAAGKPIVAVAPERRMRCCWGFSGASRWRQIRTVPRKYVNRSSRALASDPNKLKAMGEAARAAAPDYDRVKELQKFVEIIDQLTAI